MNADCARPAPPANLFHLSVVLCCCCCPRGERSTADHGVFAAKRVLQAIVTFSTPFGRQACLQQFPPGMLNQVTQSATHRLRGARLSVKAAPPPSTIRWENLGYGLVNRLGRQVPCTSHTPPQHLFLVVPYPLCNYCCEVSRLDCGRWLWFCCLCTAIAMCVVPHWSHCIPPSLQVQHFPARPPPSSPPLAPC